jgi:tRNA U34 5-methylaminomethyl-2-thiouridine-forming methyltransferase MnmC
MQFSKTHKIPIHYTSLDAYPITQIESSHLNYAKILDLETTFETLQKAPWGAPLAVSPFFELSKHEMLFEDYHSPNQFDIIYYDAFGPNTQPHLWEVDMLKNVYSFTKNNGILVTYCAKGSFRRALQQVGYKVERLEGPPGKREMIRASKHVA